MQGRCYGRAQSISFAYSTWSGLSNQLYGHISALAFAVALAKTGAPVNLRCAAGLQ